MKKILSLSLAAVMLLSILTACDMESAKGKLIGFLEKCTTTDSTKVEIRTTITEEEWNNAFNVDNFSVKMSTTDDDTVISIIVEGSELVYAITSGGQSMSLTCDLEKHVIVQDSVVGKLAYVDESISTDEALTLANMGILEAFAYADLDYSEETKSYTHNDDTEITEFFFEDGALSRIVIKTTDEEYGVNGEVYDVGTSVVELGEYTVVNDGKPDASKASADVVTTVTDEQLAAHFNMRNFTLNAASLAYGVASVNISLKAADTSLELSVDEMGEKQQQYLTLVDGEFLSIEEYGDGYLATPMGATMTNLEDDIEAAKEYVKLEHLTYNEEGRYYALEVEGETFYLYFENGQIVKAVYVVVEDEENCTEIIIVPSDIGTTSVTIPEYTLNTEE